ncbi:flagellar hook-basal body complex protein FliE [Agrobacterium sp. ES01]|uniref:flagellar hook-basal body complex protein FliE n=1 Tax=Agrobacterium sp. ES01 TaxID=3420714 RepID=UPI003D0CE68F
MIETVQKLSALSPLNGISAVTSETTEAAGKALTPGMQTGMSFSDAVGSMATDAVKNLKNAEFMSFEGIKGTANTREVVDAVMQAEQSLQTALALRDKIVSAYLEITKMQI